MFKRKSKTCLLTKIKSWFWPSIGWKKYMRYLILRLHRLGSTPCSVAAGVACGVAISFTPFVGLHFVLAGVMAFLCRGNVLASALGTAAGNPWTFPFIWYAVYHTGLVFTGAQNGANVSFLRVFEKGIHALLSFDFSEFAVDVWPVFLPMLVGCIPYYIVAWGATYYLVKKTLEKMKKNIGSKGKKA